MTLTHRWRTTSAALIAGLGLTACTAQPDEPIEIGSAATPITPTTTPTLSERDQAIADAKDTYVQFVRAYDVMGHEVGAAPTVDRVRKWVVPKSAADKDILNVSAAYREKKIHASGWTNVRRLDVKQVSLTDLKITLHTCIDSTKTAHTVSGGPKKPAFRPFQKETVQFTKQSGTWLIQDYVEISEAPKC